MLLDVIVSSPASTAVWALLVIGAVGGLALAARAVRRRRRPPEA